MVKMVGHFYGSKQPRDFLWGKLTSVMFIVTFSASNKKSQPPKCHTLSSASVEVVPRNGTTYGKMFRISYCLVGLFDFF